MFTGDWMARGAEYWPDRTAVVDLFHGAEGRYTYAQMNARANRLAGFLRARGVAADDRVGLIAPNGVEYLDVLFACAKLGALFVPLNTRLHARELEGLLQQTTPRVLFFAQELAPLAVDASRDLEPAPLMLSLSGDDRIPADGLRSAGPQSSSDSSDPSTSAPSGLRSGRTGDYQRLVREGAATPVQRENLREGDTLCLLFTGGTTGKPKGARISYRMVAWNTLNTLIHEVRPGDVTITHTPMFHTGGLLVYTLPLLASGGTVVILRKWDPELMLRTIQEERPSLFFCVPTQYQQLLEAKSFATTDFSSLRFVTSGGAPLPVPLLRAFQQQKPVPFKQGFGMTEFGPGVFSMEPEFSEKKAGSIGRPNYHVEAKLADAGGAPVERGQVGELLLRGPTVFSGYFGVEESPVDGEGWFHTGDLARQDEDGFFFIVDRKKDMFISGGENVFPAEVEAALVEHPAVRECAVVGVPDARWGEVGCAFVVLQQGHDTDAEALLQHLRTRLARYKVPKRIELCPVLPRSSAGKVLKPELRALAAGLSAEETPRC